MKILGDDAIKYSPEETAKEILALKENISSANGIKSKNLIKIKFSLIDNWHCLYFSVLDKNAPFIIKRQLEEFVGELVQEEKGGAYLYYNDSYMIWLSLGQDNFPLIIFGVKDGFTDHSLTAALSYYTFSNYGAKHPTGHNSKEDNKTTSGETKTKEFTKIFKKINEEITGKPMLDDDSGSCGDKIDIDWNKPKDIVKYLDLYVQGQFEAKKTLAVTFSNFMLKKELDDELLPIDHTLIIGPTGCGKTYMVTLLAKKAGLLFIPTTASGKSSTGYVGENLSTIFQYLGNQTDEPAPYAVIFIDEIDKISVLSDSNEPGFNRALQFEIVGWLEGAEVGIKDWDGVHEDSNTINTKNILFIFAGAFHKENDDGNSLYDIIELKNKGPRQMGFGADVEKLKPKLAGVKVTAENLIKYGIIIELIGRVSRISTADKLSKEELVNILTKSKNSILKGYISLMKKKGYKIKTSKKLPEFIVEHCPDETGARALKNVTSDIFNEIFYDPESCFNAGEKVIYLNVKLAKELLNIARCAKNTDAKKLQKAQYIKK